MPSAALAALRSSLRLLTSGPGAGLTDDQLDTFLTQNREYLHRMPLTPTPDRTVWYAGAGWWDADAALTDARGAALVATDADMSAGRFTFAASQPGTVYLTGYTYDLYAAAAAVWDYLAQGVADTFDASADGATYNLSQVVARYENRAASYRAQARASVEQVTRAYL